MNPINVAIARSARLAREAESQVVYSTRTGDQPQWRRQDDELRAWRDRTPAWQYVGCHICGDNDC